MRLAPVALALLAASAHAEPRASHWLRQHGSAEWQIAAAGFRSSFGSDPRAPGFDALAGGGELMAGLDFYGPLGIVISGRVLAGTQAGALYLEGLASAALQIRLAERVRLRVGSAAGQARLDGDRALVVGGFLAGSVDLFSLGPGRLASTLSVRLDLDALVGGKKLLPDRSLGLALGVGIRY